MDELRDIVAVVSGASRGIGSAVAIALGELGATVYVLGRATDHSPGTQPGTVDRTAVLVTAAGGRGIAVACDQRVDEQVAGVFDQVRRERGRVDVLVNSAQASPEQRVLWSGSRFWEIPLSLWDDLIDVGVRSHYVASAFAVPAMIERGHGLIVNVASHAAGTGKSARSTAIMPYSVGKAALHRLTSDMAVEARRDRYRRHRGLAASESDGRRAGAARGIR